jgi:glycosyltransferase involved in cell wall biosynthesis
MRVLLISPLPGIDPPCGDVVYTETLLAHPPQGVRYETYADAIARGALREHGDGRALRGALRDRRNLARELVLTPSAKAVNTLRQRRFLFWEPFRFFSVRPGEYDAVHVHVFSVRFLGRERPPVVVSNAAPLRYLYTEARRHPVQRVDRMEQAELALSRLMRVNATSYHLPEAERVIAFSAFLKEWYVRRGIMSADRVDVVPIYLPTLAPSARETAKIGEQWLPRRIGFIAKDFDAKGGPTVLRAFARLRQSRPDAELIIVGCAPRIDVAEAAAQGIRWLPYVPREELLSSLMPSFDVFAYPTEFDGMPLVVLEAMANGVPVATSNYQAMPEIVGGTGSITLVGDADALATRLRELLEPSTNAVMRARTRERFEARFSANSVRPLLRASYESAIHSAACHATGRLGSRVAAVAGRVG